MDHFIAVIFKTNEDQTAMLTALLMNAGFEGAEEREDKTKVFIVENCFDETVTTEIFKQFDLKYIIEKIARQNWNATWESSFEPVQVDDFAAIRASFHAPVKDVAHDIIITPKMSFGTGHHATTYLMIQEMRLLNFEEKSVVDFGTGTGVLAILAEKLGAKNIIAIDYDEWSIDNAKENIEANNCSRIDLYKADQMLADKKAAIILANINLNVILENIKLIKHACLNDSFILFSGLLIHDEIIMREILIINGLRVLKVVDKNNWIAILAIPEEGNQHIIF